VDRQGLADRINRTLQTKPQAEARASDAASAITLGEGELAPPGPGDSSGANR
jgi:hypothetical protein